MADTTVVLGSTGISKRLRDNGDGTYSDTADIASVTACPLVMGGSARVSKTLTSASTNYAFDANIPAGSKYVELFCASACQVAVGEATSATLGRHVPGGLPVTFLLSDANVAAGKALHAQSATAGAVIYATYLAG